MPAIFFIPVPPEEKRKNTAKRVSKMNSPVLYSSSQMKNFYDAIMIVPSQWAYSTGKMQQTGTLSCAVAARGGATAGASLIDG
ncbi:hypothetical protein [Desulfocastanea catecholica]